MPYISFLYLIFFCNLLQITMLNIYTDLIKLKNKFYIGSIYDLNY